MDPDPKRVVRAGPQCNGFLAPPDNPLVYPRRQPSWVLSQARLTLALAVAAAPPEVLRDPPPGDGGARLQPARLQLNIPKAENLPSYTSNEAKCVVVGMK